MWDLFILVTVLAGIYIILPVITFLLWECLGLTMQFFPNKKIKRVAENAYCKIFSEDGKLERFIYKFYPFLRD